MYKSQYNTQVVPQHLTWRLPEKCTGDPTDTARVATFEQNNDKRSGKAFGRIWIRAEGIDQGRGQGQGKGGQGQDQGQGQGRGQGQGQGQDQGQNQSYIQRWCQGQG